MATTVIRERLIPEHQHSDNGLSFLLGIILLLIVGFLLFYYGLPAMKNIF